MFPLHLLHRCIFAKNLDFRLQFDALLPIDDTLDVRHQGKEIFGSAAAVDKETGVLFAHLCAADARTPLGRTHQSAAQRMRLPGA